MSTGPRPDNPSDSEPQTPITALLAAAREGDLSSRDALFERVYATLRSLADRVFQDKPGSTLQPTALVHEAWLKLAASDAPYADREHFLAVASLSMRQVLQDHIRGRGRLKRTGKGKRVTLGDTPEPGFEQSVDLLDLSNALEELDQLHERHAKVVAMRVLAGMTIVEVAAALGVSRATIESDWKMGRAWLRSRLVGEADATSE